MLTGVPISGGLAALLLIAGALALAPTEGGGAFWIRQKELYAFWGVFFFSVAIA